MAADGPEVSNGKRYSYAGPPKISLTTWNERPRRQVSIKTDRDYVVGVVSKYQQQQQTEQPKKAEDNDVAATSRVPPVVRSVELKRPYVERLLQRRTVGNPALAALSEVVRAQAKLSNGCADATHPKSVLEEKRQRFTFGQLTTGGRPSRPKEAAADPRETLLQSIRSFGGRDNLRKIRA